MYRYRLFLTTKADYTVYRLWFIPQVELNSFVLLLLTLLPDPDFPCTFKKVVLSFLYKFPLGWMLVLALVFSLRAASVISTWSRARWPVRRRNWWFLGHELNLITLAVVLSAFRNENWFISTWSKSVLSVFTWRHSGVQLQKQCWMIPDQNQSRRNFTWTGSFLVRMARI